MKSYEDFQDAISAKISNYPAAAQLYQARDPRLLAQLNAMAFMLSMFSSEQDVASMEPWTKARDSTVLADAAAKGILPFGKATRVSLPVTNTSTSPLLINTGRIVLDTTGRKYVVDTGATISASGSGSVTAIQREDTGFTHTVAVSQPFYRVEVPQPAEGKYIESVRVDGYTYNPDFNNTAIGEKAFNLLTDENRRLYIQFGYTGVVGYQPDAGETITVHVEITEGAIDLQAGSPFAFEYSFSLFENGATITLGSVLSPGAAPMDIATMREVTAYPSVYDTSAVFLGNFDFLIRRNLSPFRFLSVWNEYIEEAARGPSLDNINTLFIAAQKDGVDDATLQSQITALIKTADDSYKLSFVDVVDHEIPFVVDAKVSPVYDFAAVQQQIRELILGQYGETSNFAQRGQTRILKKRVYDLLEDNVQALQDEVSDFEVDIDDPIEEILPEEFRYVSETSLVVNVTQAD